MKRIRNLLKKIVFACERPFLRLKKKKDVLLIVRNPVMLSYARPVYTGLQEDSRLRVWLCFPWPEHFTSETCTFKEIREKYKPRIIPYKIARYLKWDLILFPDHSPYFRKDCPKIYIAHGFALGKKLKGECYTYGARCKDTENNIIYEKMFISSDFIKSVLVQLYPEFSSRIKVVGNLLCDEIKKQVNKKDEVLRSINLDPNRKTIIVMSSWGPLSLIRSQGLNLIKKFPKITEKYNLIVAVHFNNFMARHSGGIDWNHLLTTSTTKNMYVIPRKEEPHPLLINADLAITDFTSLSLYFTAFGRPIILIDNPEVEYVENSFFSQMRKITPVIKDISNIESDIEEAFANFNPSGIKEVFGRLVSYQGCAWERFAEEIYDSLALQPA